MSCQICTRRLFYRALLQKRPIIWSILLTEATPYRVWVVDIDAFSQVGYASRNNESRLTCKRVGSQEKRKKKKEKRKKEKTCPKPERQGQQFFCTALHCRRPVESFKLQVIFCKRATSYRALLRKMTCTDKASYVSPQNWSILGIIHRVDGREVLTMVIYVSAIDPYDGYDKSSFHLHRVVLIPSTQSIRRVDGHGVLTTQ